jgi:hypothetical protein
VTDLPAEALERMTTEKILLATSRALNEDSPQPNLGQLLSAVRSRLPTMSPEDLLRTFFSTWLCDKDLFNSTEIFTVLRSTSGQQFDDDIDKWMQWFLARTDPSLNIAKFWIKIQHDIYKSEPKSRRQPEKS